MYDFIVDKDWFNRKPPFVFNFEHCMFIIFYIALGIVVALWLKNKPKEFTKKVLTWIWIITLIMDTIKWSASWYVWHINGSISNLNIVFPLYTCSLFIYLTPVALFAKNEKLQTAAKNFMCTMMLPLGFVSIFLALMMTTDCSVFSFYGFHTLFFHAMMYVVSLSMLVSGYYKPQKDDIKKGLTLFGCILAAVYIFDCILKVDYMYIYNGSTFTVLSFLINILPHRLVWTLLIMIFYFTIPTLMHFIILKIQSVLENKKASNQDTMVVNTNV